MTVAATINMGFWGLTGNSSDAMLINGDSLYFTNYPNPCTGTTMISPIGFGETRIIPYGGEKSLDIQTIQEFKKLSADEKYAFIMGQQNLSYTDKLLAMWLKDLERQITKG